MTVRPDEVPDWAWAEAETIETTPWGSDDWHPLPWRIEKTARAILKAREEAFEEAAKIAEYHAENQGEYLPEEVVIACGQADYESGIRSALHPNQESGE